MRIFTDDRCTTYARVGHPETPARVRETRRRLAASDLPITWEEPTPAPDALLLLLHTRKHLERLERPADFDPNTPWYPDLPDLARRSAGAALAATDAALRGELTFSLMRPPGHHALPERAMGFCYLANAALAALHAHGDGRRVAVFDFDVHHGNGTEALLVDRPGFAYVSVHRSPGFPHTGLEDRGTNCFNHPVVPHADRTVYRDALARALDRLVAFRPDFVVVSAGFDAYVDDPIGKECLDVDDFAWLGGQIQALGLPATHLLEGGYADALPELIEAYLRASHSALRAGSSARAH